jgi:hypothetical protein
MGFGSEETGRVLRFSSGWETTLDDWHALADGVVAVLQDLRAPMQS